MGSYHNAYSIMRDVRDGVNEYTDALHKGTDTYGKYSNHYLLNSINRAQRSIYAKLFKRIPEEFMTSSAITGVNSVYTLPWDYGQVRRFEDENDYKVHPVTIDHRPRLGGEGSDAVYYKQGNTFVLTKTGVTETYTLWYYKKPRELNMGQASSEDTLATAVTPAKEIADYYNNMIIEQTTGTTAYGTITDYSAARVITSGITLANSAYYGIVSDLPEMFHPLIAPLAVMLAKAQHPVSPEKPTKSEIGLWNDELEDAILAFAGSKPDVPPEDIFTDFGGYGGGGVNIPNQGYVIR